MMLVRIVAVLWLALVLFSLVKKLVWLAAGLFLVLLALSLAMPERKR